MNKKILMLTLGTSVMLTGCGSLLYGNTLAPIFSSHQTPAKRRTPPPVLSQRKAPVQQSRNRGVVVERTQNNPYGNNPYGNPAPKPSNTVEKVKRKVDDSRVREGSEVLAEGSAPTDASVPMRPRQQVAKRPAVAVKEPVNEPAVREKVTEKVVEKTKPVNSTIKEQTTTAVAATKTKVEEAATTVEKTAKVEKPAPSTTKSATRTLLQEAKTAVAAGDYDKAASALERAHRIEPGNAKILYDIAQIRNAQGKYRQAASFASKAATYSNSPALSKKVWTLLSNVRKKLGNNTGAAAAAQKAASF